MVALAIAGLLLAACAGDKKITADTSCHDYLQHDAGQRHDAAVRVSADLHTTDAGNPMWGPSLDAACGSNQNMTLRQYFSQ